MPKVTSDGYSLRIRQPKNLPINQNWVKCYWVESTAPINVDDPQQAVNQAANQDQATPNNGCAPDAEKGGALDRGVPMAPNPNDIDATLDFFTDEGDPDQMLRQIAAHLYAHKDNNPQIVVTVHGFNNSRADAWKRHFDSYLHINRDPAIKNSENIICLGYRWPAEKMFRNLDSALPALPLLGMVLGAASAIVALLGREVADNLEAVTGGLSRWLKLPVAVLALVLAILPLSALLLRAIVYFRDVYRATHYAVPDLVELLRQLDELLVRLDPDWDKRVKLSFIGHSMGAFVVTQLVRTLSDVFHNSNRVERNKGADSGDGPTLRLDSESKQKEKSSAVGQRFSLERLVLVSPDIPAEALMTRRANFLAPSLRRFRECYLFSNEGDVVLGLVSTLANSFSFPARERNSGMRLGNVQVVSSPPDPNVFGIVNFQTLKAHCNMAAPAFLKHLQLGAQDFLQIYRGKRDTTEVVVAAPGVEDKARTENAGEEPLNAEKPPELPLRFTFFDCTDYRDKTSRLSWQWQELRIDEQCSQEKVLLLGAGRPKAHLRWWNHLELMGRYATGCPDVHGGYFNGPTVRALIYRLACVGLEDTLDAMNQAAAPIAPDANRFDALHGACKDHQIQVLLSPILYQRTLNCASSTPPSNAN